MDLSIIVPVYNVEKYVRPCLESILRQGLDKSRYEIIMAVFACLYFYFISFIIF